MGTRLLARLANHWWEDADQQAEDRAQHRDLRANYIWKAIQRRGTPRAMPIPISRRCASTMRPARLNCERRAKQEQEGYRSM
jgi:hypothetical protein